MRWLIYGANGYTGELVARRALADGERPILAGRNGPAMEALGGDLGLEHRVVALSDAASLRAALADVDAVAHCAGPFSATARPMVDACLATGTHYLDVTGEVQVFEAIYGRHDDAVAAGVVLLPGGGFDVVPTDCLAARLAAALPGATELDLAFVLRGGRASRGTLRSALSGMAAGGLRRVDGRLVPAPPGRPSRTVEFPTGRASVGAIRWGDLVSAYRSTGIPTITMYARLAPGGLMRVAGPPLGHLMALGAVRRLAGALVGRLPAGADAAARARSRCEVWGEVRDPAGNTVAGTLTGPDPYDLTADAVVRAVTRLGEVAPGAHTPSTAFGPEFVETLDGVSLPPVTQDRRT
jgi:short subunit dehydrogenase-like uncharacterized protein